jgi:hypothetical protein
MPVDPFAWGESHELIKGGTSKRSGRRQGWDVQRGGGIRLGKMLGEAARYVRDGSDEARHATVLRVG